jgi:hypothetical protein
VGDGLGTGAGLLGDGLDVGGVVTFGAFSE